MMNFIGSSTLAEDKGRRLRRGRLAGVSPGVAARAVLLAEFAENEIVVFAVGVAGKTGSFSLGCYIATRRVALGKTHKFPAPSRVKVLALLHHDINSPCLPFDGVACDLLGFKQVIDNY